MLCTINEPQYKACERCLIIPLTTFTPMTVCLYALSDKMCYYPIQTSIMLYLPSFESSFSYSQNAISLYQVIITMTRLSTTCSFPNVHNVEMYAVQALTS
jgi:hypothetical protein